jgi:hypothetical protein
MPVTAYVGPDRLSSGDSWGNYHLMMMALSGPKHIVNEIVKIFVYVVLILTFLTLSVVGWDTTLQAGRSPVRIPDEVDFFSLPNPSRRTMALGSTQPLTEMSTGYVPGGKKRPARRADNLAAIYKPNVWKCGEPQPPATPSASTACTGITLPYLYLYIVILTRKGSVARTKNGCLCFSSAN